MVWFHTYIQKRAASINHERNRQFTLTVTINERQICTVMSWYFHYNVYLHYSKLSHGLLAWRSPAVGNPSTYYDVRSDDPLGIMGISGTRPKNVAAKLLNCWSDDLFGPFGFLALTCLLTLTVTLACEIQTKKINKTMHVFSMCSFTSIFEHNPSTFNILYE